MQTDAVAARAQTDRAQLLAECIKGALGLSVERVVVGVLTNAPVRTAQELSSNFAGTSDTVSVTTLPDLADFDSSHGGDRRVLSIGWKPGLVTRHGFFLTWAHKKLFRRALEQADFSHFIYLEDDIRFTDQSFSYWCHFRGPLAEHGLLPGFVRYESTAGALWVVDQMRRQHLDRPRVRCAQVDSETRPGDGVSFVGLDNPYQGMYVLDRALAIRHFTHSVHRDPIRSASVRRWNVRERASIGPIFDDVPSGFGSRNVVPVLDSRDGKEHLDRACLVEHLTGNYSVSPETAFGKIRADELFTAD